MSEEQWRGEPDPTEQARRREALERLAAAARRLGVSADRLAALLRGLESNETATRKFLAEEVYGVPDELLDDVVRIRLGELGDGGRA